MWQYFNNILNSIGGLISLLGLLLSIFIYIKTGKIKKSIKNLLNHEQYVKQKVATKTKLEGILSSIVKDNLFDKGIIGEINREIATLTHYEVFFDRKTKKNIKNIRKLLQDDFSYISKEKLIIEINKIIGDLTIDETYIG